MDGFWRNCYEDNEDGSKATKILAIIQRFKFLESWINCVSKQEIHVEAILKNHSQINGMI